MVKGNEFFGREHCLLSDYLKTHQVHVWVSRLYYSVIRRRCSLYFTCAASQFVYESISTTDWTELFLAVVIMVMQLIYSIKFQNIVKKSYVYRFVCKCMCTHVCLCLVVLETYVPYYSNTVTARGTICLLRFLNDLCINDLWRCLQDAR